MSMLNALSVFLVGGDSNGQIRAARSLERQRFVRAAQVEWDGGSVVAWGHPDQRQAEDCLVQTPSGTACCVGPLWFRGHFGRQALASLLDEVRATGCLEEGSLRGNFALFLDTGEHTWLLNDALGFVRIYTSADDRFFSTSWLAVCAYGQCVEPDAASAIEYVLLGAAHSCHSVARGVDLIPLGQVMDLRQRRAWQRFPHGFDVQAPEFHSLDEAVEDITEHLRMISAEVASAFPGQINAALSGGFDSRLIVAGLLAAGVRPRLFVYGDADSADVAVARTVATAADLAFEAIDKCAMNRGLPMPDIEALEQSALFFDGLPSDGIDDPGADRRTRLQQTADGCIALNGGGGEIFRNFFHLPNRAFNARDIVKTFYRGFSRGVFRDPNGLASYEARLAASMRNIVGMSEVGSELLSRTQVELLYSLFRCHYWMGVNNSVAVRHGNYTTPLVDLESVRLALRVPLRWKNAGALESRLVAALHPAIAAQPSAYGFRFDAGPGWKERLAEWTACARPVRLRPLINATHRNLQNVLQVAPAVLQRYRALLPGEGRMDSLLDLIQLADERALGRALAVEVVWRRLL
ncbi:asparagine synthase [Rhodanobacter sp. OR444]|uniref:asparagine synthase n=1 Tax=Rhodanobacter sp. OR444 TaxID=1076525 RepID=UPI000424122A|nr:asparagine synthase [Rhodanobacter sp. OR444]